MNTYHGDKVRRTTMKRRKNGSLLSFSTILLLSSFLFSTIMTQANGQYIIDFEEDEDFPEFRFVLWSSLNGADRSSASDLTYTEETWNTPGSATIEYLAFSDLRNRQNPAKKLGFIEEIWDCYINHYEGYDWDDLEDEEVQQFFRILGWSEKSWEGDIDAPITDTADWINLTETQQEAADELCFFEQLWDEEHLTNYTDAPTYAPTTMSPTAAPQPTASPTEFDPFAPTQMPVPTTPSPTSLAPTMYPTKPPVTASPTTPAPTPLPTFLPFPYFRYEKYADIDGDTRNQASVLSYTSNSWNEIGTNDLENTSFSNLDRGQKEAATAMGFTEETWDCYQAHYGDYEWAMLEIMGLDSAFQMLGWDEDSWNSNTVRPVTADAAWSTLSVDEKFAARKLCYFQEIWDGLNLLTWDALPFPHFRYVAYKDLNDDNKETVTRLSYSEKTWNILGTGSIEEWSFDGLTETEKGLAASLGFMDVVWDCYINHYDNYDWSELVEAEVHEAYMALGWSEESWDGDAAEPMSNDKDWEYLTPEEKAGAKKICYFRETWNGIPISSWSTSTTSGGRISDDDDTSTGYNGRALSFAFLLTLTFNAGFVLFEI